MAQHRIVPRAEWRAAPPKAGHVPMRLPVGELWGHHTATDFTRDPRADARTVQRVAFGRGFTDISYSYLIHPDGTILEGRGLHIGAHTAKRNSIALAISFIGNYSKHEPTEAQQESARWLVQHLMSIGALRRDFQLRGHRQNPASPSECPGNRLFPRLGEWLQPLRHSTQEDEMTPELKARLDNIDLRLIEIQQELVKPESPVRQQLNAIQTSVGHAETYVREAVRGVRALAVEAGYQAAGGRFEKVQEPAVPSPPEDVPDCAKTDSP